MMDILEEKSITQVLKESLSKAISYGDYRILVAQLAIDGKSTSPFQNEALTKYTLLNDKRMKRLDKTLKFSDSIISKIKKIDKKVTWLVLTESWCGDAAQTMPIMNKIAELNSNIDFKVVLRDENLALINHFLTNGTLSIPKLIMIDDATNAIFSDWGPRPSIATKMVDIYKKRNGVLTDEFKQELQLWYTKDKGQNTVEDLLSCLLLK
tara:strand:- start:2591 stop:3217 length:627 start_codon:yes stop_codon:yes gene_type:complete